MIQKNKVTKLPILLSQLEMFFLDNTLTLRPIQYAQRFEVSRHQGQNILDTLVETNLLQAENKSGWMYYSIKRGDDFRKQHELYWNQQFKTSGLTDYLYEVFPKSLVCVYGKFADLEVTPSAPLQIGIHGNFSRTDVEEYEEKLKRSIDVSPIYLENLRYEQKRFWQL